MNNQTEAHRALPHDEEIERAVVGACIIEPAQIDKIRAILEPRHFYHTAPRVIYETLSLMHEDGLPVRDIALLTAKLKARNLWSDAGGPAGLATCMQAALPSSARSYADVIVDLANRRAFADIAIELRKRSLDPTNTSESVAQWLDAKSQQVGIAEDCDVVTLYQAARKALNRTVENSSSRYAVGIPCGLHGIDESTGGLYPGELNVIAARPSMGKTSLGIQQALYSASNNRTSLFISLEMHDWELAQRITAARAQVNSSDLRSGDVSQSEFDRVEEAVKAMEAVPLYVWRPKKATIERIRAKCRLMKATTGLDMVIIDYLTKIAATNPKEVRHEQIEHQIGSAKDLASELDVPVVMLAQARRTEKNRPVRLEDLYGSSTIEADADSVWMIHRETRASTEATIEIAKNRFGATGSRRFGYDLNTTTFYDVEEDVD